MSYFTLIGNAYTYVKPAVDAGVLCVKAYTICSSAHKIYTTIYNDRLTRIQKIHNVGTNAIYIVSAGLANFPTASVSKEVIQAATVITPFTRLGKQCSDDSIDPNSRSTAETYLKLFCFELIDNTEAMRLLQAFAAIDETSNLPLLAEGVAAIALVYFNKKEISEIPEGVRTLWRNATDAFNHLRAERVNFAVRAEPNGQPVLRVPRERYQQFEAIQRVENIDQFNDIPRPLINPLFTHYTCPITQQPIRHLRIVRGTEGTDNPIFYEQRAIAEWLQANPGTPPAGWPSGITYSGANIIEARDHQAAINRQLQSRLDNFKKVRYEPNPEEVAEPDRKKRK